MEKVQLAADIREDLGKSASKHLRKSGKVPAVVYKDGKAGANLQVDSNDLWHALHTEAGENAIITLEISGKDKPSEKTVIIKEIQADPINEKFIHVDFHEISLKEKLKVKVPVVVKGEAIGVTEEEGMLSQHYWELEIECLPTDIPENIEVRVDDLKIGDAINVKDITPPAGVEFLDDPEGVVVAVTPPQEEEELEEEAAEEVAGEEGEAAEPEVIKKGKKEEEAEEEGQEEAPAAPGEES